MEIEKRTSKDMLKHVDKSGLIRIYWKIEKQFVMFLIIFYITASCKIRKCLYRVFKKFSNLDIPEFFANKTTSIKKIFQNFIFKPHFRENVRSS